MLVASATIDGHAVALRLERADILTIPRWVDARPVSMVSGADCGSHPEQS